MPLTSSLRAYAQLVDAEAGKSVLRSGDSGTGIAKVKQSLYDMGYRITPPSIPFHPSAYFNLAFDAELGSALQKLAATESARSFGAVGVIDQLFLRTFDKILTGGDFRVPDYSSSPAPAAAGETSLSAGIQQLTQIRSNIAAAAAVVRAANASLTGTGDAAAYAKTADAFELNFALDRITNKSERALKLNKIAKILSDMNAYLQIPGNFMYAPPALVLKHKVVDGALAYFLSTDSKVYFTDSYLTLRPGGRLRATTHELVHAAGIDHGTSAKAPPYWWNLDAYDSLTPEQRLNNADNYVWFIDHCIAPYGRKQPKP